MLVTSIITHKYMGNELWVNFPIFLEIMGNGDMAKILQIEIYG